ncbi:MAG: N-acetylmuramoyl-L-alanine amidase [Clostridiales bacterium]|jgi:N-acetylmuramoyl-L-alanine amidase|nr:N-acetylmuramoyl-L-alanine amidase [Clostridiales bacterium]
MKVISVKKEQIMAVFFAAVILFGLAGVFRDDVIATFAMPVANKVVIIDSGHGGFDPGKVVDKNIQEKDINLQIAKKLQAYLEQGGAYVIMTRVADEALGSRKNSDMRNRKTLINESKADILVSIHQNAYSNTSVAGAQVFYFGKSENSKKLAEKIQTEMKTFLGQKTKLEAKSNSSYFMLRSTVLPAVIVECGFLTNATEKQKLTQDEYQEKIAWGIYTGIIKYFEEE